MKRTLLLALAFGLLTANPEAAQVRARTPAVSSGGAGPRFSRGQAVVGDSIL